MESEETSDAAGRRDEIPDSGEVIVLSPEDQLRVVEAILNPPEPAEALVRVFQQHRHHAAHAAMRKLKTIT